MRSTCATGLFVTLAVFSSCKEEKPKSVWPTDTPSSQKITTTPEEERVDLYGDRVPAGSIARLGSVRMLDRKLGRAIFSADGTEIVTSSEEAYLIWQTTTAQRLGTLEVSGAAPAMAMKSDGELLATALYGGSIQLWDYPARKGGAVLRGHRKVVTSMCFSSDTLVSGSEDRTVRVWPKEGEGVQLRGEWEKVTAVGCTATGAVLFGDDGGSVWLTNAKGEAPKQLMFGKKLTDAQTPVTSVALAADEGPYAVGLGDGAIAIWKSATAMPIRFDGHPQRTLTVAFTSDGKLMSSGGDSQFRVWDPSTGEKLLERKGGIDVSTQLFRMSADGAFLVAYSELKDGRASEAGRFWLYDGKTGAQLLEPDRHREGLSAIAFAAGGKKLITAAADGRVLVWNVADAALSRTLAKHKGPVRALAFGKGKWFSVGDDARMHSSTVGGDDSIILEPIGGAVHALAVEPSGARLLIGDFAGKVWSFSRKSGAKIARHDSEAFSTIHSLAYSPDGKKFAIAGGNRHMHVVSAATGKKLTLLSPEGVVANHAVTFSADGKLLATGGDDHVVRLWDTQTWKQLAALEGHDGTIRALAFSPDGKRLASGSSDEVARLWRVSDNSEMTLYAVHRGAVTAVAFSPDGKLLATGSRDRTALIWTLPTPGAEALLPAKKADGGVVQSDKE